MKAKHPMQPVVRDKNGVHRFKKNRIVDFLITCGGFDMNEIAIMNFPREDREQFAMLIGYSVSGFGELNYVSEETVRKADVESAKLARRKK